jgi:hypothetical protein
MMSEDETALFEKEIEDYMAVDKFKSDMHGRVLRYKILVRDLAIRQILYNTGKSVDKIPFEEFRITEGDLYTICNENLSPENTVFGTVKHIPVGMIACEESEEVVRDTLEEGSVKNPSLSHCQMRVFDRLSGQIDMEIESADAYESLNAE